MLATCKAEGGSGLRNTQINIYAIDWLTAQGQHLTGNHRVHAGCTVWNIVMSGSNSTWRSIFVDSSLHRTSRYVCMRTLVGLYGHQSSHISDGEPGNKARISSRIIPSTGCHGDGNLHELYARHCDIKSSMWTTHSRMHIYIYIYISELYLRKLLVSALSW